jgi:CRISPR-associated protein Csb1
MRALRGSDDGQTLVLRQYVLGLALVAATLPGPHDLRQGCLLVQDGANAGSMRAVEAGGSERPFEVSHDDALKYAGSAAERFGVAPDREVAFEPDAARAELQAFKAKKAKKKGAR